jgi:hypothetical protein
MEKKIVREKKWITEIIEYEDGTSEMKRTNFGFNATELLGVLEFTREDIYKQIRGDIHPDIVKRTIVEEDK